VGSSAIEQDAMPLQPPACLVAALRKERSATRYDVGAVHVELLAIALERSDDQAHDLDVTGRGAVREADPPDASVYGVAEKSEGQKSEKNPSGPLL